MASRPSDRRKKQQAGGGPKKRAPKGPLATSARTVGARRRPQDGVWELVHPRCARDRREDLEEVRLMLEAGEIDVAIDECRWLLEGCSDCLEAHQILGEIALEINDLPLARGHFGYAFRLGSEALRRAGGRGPMPYHLPANQGFHTSGKALAWCLKQLQKPEMAAEIVARLLECDPSDPLGAKQLLDHGEPEATAP